MTCNWFSTPLLDFTNGVVEPRMICPRCGSSVEMAVGKYSVRETFWLFGILKDREYLAFERKLQGE